MIDDRTYYARRAAEQRDRAERAGDDGVRQRHLELAELLAARAEDAAE
jgi:hypothetical protein